jgi:predicted permease
MSKGERERGTPARLASLLRRLAARLGFGARDPGSEAEIELHLAMLAERYRREGLTPEDAAFAARRQFGNLTLLQEERRALKRPPALESAWRLVRDGLRQWRVSPLFTATAVLSLALGIGLSTGVFTLLDQLVLRLLPVAAPERLVMIWSTGPNLGDTRNARASSLPLCQDYQRLAGAFDAVFCRAAMTAALSIDRRTEPVTAELVSGNYFQALGVGAAHGRVFSADLDDRVDRGHPVVILSHRYWAAHLQADPSIVGRKVLVNQQPMDVVGIADPGFTGIDAAEAPQLWIPIRMKALLTPGEDGLNDRHYDFLQIFGRMKAGQSVENVRASLQPLFTRMLEAELSDPQIARASAYDRERFRKRLVLVEPAGAGYSEMRQRYERPLVMLMAMSGLMLLIACSNVASLLVARGLARQKDMALRLAIGAGRGVLVGQLLVESVLLSLAGAALGFVLSTGATRALLAMLPAGDALLLLRAEPDLRIMAFGIATSVATAILFGLVPALQTTRIDLCAALKVSTGGVVGGSGRSTRVRKILVASQVALSFLLLVAAGLFARTLINLRSIDTGIQQIDRLVTFQLDPAKSGYPASRIRQLYADLLADLQSTPGVTAVAHTWIPLLGGWAPTWNMRVEGYAAKNGEDMEVGNNIVSPGYWRTMGITLLEGRDFEDGDRYPPEVERMPSVALVNRTFARRFFGAETAVGRRFGVGEEKDRLGVRIVGVVPDALVASPRVGGLPQVFFSSLQTNYPISATFYVRSSLSAEAIAPALRRVVAARDPTLPVLAMKTLARQLDDTLSVERLIASLSVVFAAIATVMAALGLYGVMAFAVARRTKELGLRAALGASTGSMLWLVLREALTMLAAGLIVGVPCAWLLGAYVASQLFGVAPTDGATVAAAAIALTIVALAATLLPASRAGRLDPLRALRQD